MKLKFFCFILLLWGEGKEELSVWKTFKRIKIANLWEYNGAVVILRLIQSFWRTVNKID